MAQKPHLILRVKLLGEVYDRIYGMHDIQHVVELFNEIHKDGMRVTIEEIEKEIPKKDTES